MGLLELEQWGFELDESSPYVRRIRARRSLASKGKKAVFKAVSKAAKKKFSGKSGKGRQAVFNNLSKSNKGKAVLAKVKDAVKKVAGGKVAGSPKISAPIGGSVKKPGMKNKVKDFLKNNKKTIAAVGGAAVIAGGAAVVANKGIDALKKSNMGIGSSDNPSPSFVNPSGSFVSPSGSSGGHVVSVSNVRTTNVAARCASKQTYKSVMKVKDYGDWSKGEWKAAIKAAGYDNPANAVRSRNDAYVGFELACLSNKRLGKKHFSKMEDKDKKFDHYFKDKSKYVYLGRVNEKCDSWWKVDKTLGSKTDMEYLRCDQSMIENIMGAVGSFLWLIILAILACCICFCVGGYCMYSKMCKDKDEEEDDAI